MKSANRLTIDQIRGLQLEITSYCNSKCPHCPRFTPDGDLEPTMELAHWPFSKIKDNFEITRLKSLEYVIIEGDKGDPAMHPDAKEIVEFFVTHPNAPNVYFVTNGSIQNENWWRDLGRLGENLQVTFSIDGLEDTNHIYRVGIEWNRIMRNAKSFIDSGGRARWKCLVFKHNQHQISDIAQLAESLGFECVDFQQPFINRFTPTWFSDKNQWPIYYNGSYLGELLPSDLDASMIRSHQRNFRPVPTNNILKSDILDYICPHLRKAHLYITYQSHVVPCCMMHNYLYESDRNLESARMIKDFVRDVDSIDISKSTLESILASDFYRYTLEDHLGSNRHLGVCKASCSREISDFLIKNRPLNNRLCS